ncbi:protein-L-isoaspartate O-methyltransferase [Sandarakinorhabdus sp.]|uniref:protein-L-isoaspartate O-methyltransferase family protein n=1 Tax=Sandarakinorhabdus sp. TaxID=1916663 RepID=UPI00286DD0BC|nr:protein-L-isoaspartate O-methyltransferase [Sandarakinorhabdus sp.]
MTSDFSAMRQSMIDSQLKTVGITDASLLAAMGTVPREIFLGQKQQSLAYADAAQPLAPGRWLLEPLVLALLLQNAGVTPGMRVLVVGSGSGYSAAVLAHMGAQVTALESDTALAALAESAGVVTRTGPLADGWAPGAPYDLMLFEGAIEHVPAALWAQLAGGGRIAAVVRTSGVGGAYAGSVLADGAIAGLPFLEVAAYPLPGFARPKKFAF